MRRPVQRATEPAPLRSVVEASSKPPADGRYLNAHEVRPGLVRAYWRDGDRLFWRDEPVLPCLFLRKTELAAQPAIERALRNSRYVRGVREEGEHLRVSFREREACRRLSEKENWKGEPGYLWGKNLEPLEADVSAVRRWSVDNRTKLQKPRRCYLDIETDSRLSMLQKRDMRILCWAVVDDEGRKLTGLLRVDTNADEKRLLEELVTAIDGYDQVLAWNGDRFDFDVIRSRCEQRHVRIDWERFLWLDHLALYKRMIQSGGVETGDQKTSMALERVAKGLAASASKKLLTCKPEERTELERRVKALGAGKKKGTSGESLGAHTWQLWETDPELLRTYCLDDALLLPEIERATGYIEVHVAICDACGVFPDSRGLFPTQYVESFLMRLGVEKGMRFPTLYKAEDSDKKKREKFAGAYVQAPTDRGVLRDVHVCDFAGLYPSIILTWNMSPETYRPDIHLREDVTLRPTYLSHLPIKESPLPEGHCVAALTDCVFTTGERGILPTALEEIGRLRKYWTKLKASYPPGTPEHHDADRRATSYKVCRNSFYGVVGSPFSRFFLKPVAQSVAQQGVWMIKHVNEEALRLGYRVIYTDTDGSYVTGCTREEFSRFVGWVNTDLIPRLVASRGCPQSFIELEHEKGFDRICFVAKKKYAGAYSYYKNEPATKDSEPEIKGLEFKRGDSVQLARRMQARCAYALLGFHRKVREDAKAYHRIVYGFRAMIARSEVSVDEVLRSVKLTDGIRGRYTKKPRKTQPKKIERMIGEWVECFERGKRSLHNVGEAAGRVRKAAGYLHAVSRETIDVRKPDTDEVVTINMAEAEVVVYESETAHVKVARQLLQRGRDVGKGTKVPYYFRKASKPTPTPAEDYDGDVDRTHLWEKLVWPPTRRLLEAAFPGEDWSRYAKLVDEAPKQAPKQATLFA